MQLACLAHRRADIMYKVSQLTQVTAERFEEGRRSIVRHINKVILYVKHSPLKSGFKRLNLSLKRSMLCLWPLPVIRNREKTLRRCELWTGKLTYTFTANTHDKTNCISVLPSAISFTESSKRSSSATTPTGRLATNGIFNVDEVKEISQLKACCWMVC